ncbi:MAG: phage tail tape measure protein [Brochothrix thermosphacta]|uniref:phage tail tape measure protein n=1 Tax=Brochothrix thermosphacta TaxID=2756 RepID=UPI003F8F18BE
MSNTERIKGMEIALGLDTKGVDEGMAGLKRTLGNVNQEMKANLSAFDKGEQSTKKYEAVITGLTKKMEVQSKMVKQTQGDYKTLQERNKSLNGEIEKSNRVLTESKKRYDDLKKSGTANKTELAAAKKEVSANQKEYTKLNKELQDMPKALNNAEKAVNKEVESFNTLSKRIDGATKAQDKFNKAQAVENSPFTKRSKELEAYSKKLETASEKSAAVGRKMTLGVTTPIVAGFAGATKAVIDYESAFAGVRKTVDATEEQYAEISKTIIDMSKALPASANDIAAVAESAGQLGIERENIAKFSRTIIDLGESTNLTQEQAATEFARFANIMQMSQTKFDRLGSSIVDLGNNFATTESEISSMAMRLAGVGNQIGMSEADVVGLATAMSSVGIEAEAGGTAMSMALKKMQNAVASHSNYSEKIAKAEKNLSSKGLQKFIGKLDESERKLDSFASVAGVTSDEFTKLFSEEPAKALQLYVEGLGKASANGENLNDVLQDVGIQGIRESDTMLRLAGNSKLLGKALDVSTKAWDENSALTNEANERYKTTASKIKVMKNNFVAFGISMGKTFAPVISDVTEKVTKFINSIDNMSDGAKKTTMVIAGTAAAIGPLALGISSVQKVSSAALGGLSLLNKGLGFLAPSLAGASKEAKAADIGIGGMAKSSKSLLPGLAGIPLPALAATAAIVGISFAAYKGVKAFKAHQEEQENTAKTTEKFGSDVSDATAKAADGFVTMRDEANTQLVQLETLSGEKSEKISGLIVSNYTGMASEVTSQLSKLKKETEDVFDSIDKDYGERSEKWKLDTKTDTSKAYEQEIQAVKKASDRIKELLKDSGKDLNNMTVAQRKEFDTLTSFVGEKTSVFAASYRDLEGMSSSWAKREGQITKSKYEDESKILTEAKDKTNKESQKAFDKSKEILEQNLRLDLMSQKDHDIALGALEAKKIERTVKTDAAFLASKTSMAKHAKKIDDMNLDNMQTLEAARSEGGAAGTRYWVESQERWVKTSEEWLAITKKNNQEFIKSSGELTDTQKKQMEDYETLQYEYYKSVGHSGAQADIFAQQDRAKLESTMTATGIMINAQSKKAKAAYLDGLKSDGEVTKAAEKWGLDLTNTADKIDMGKYGLKTAKEFFDEFQSGTDEGTEMAKIFFGQKLESLAGKDLSEIGKKNVETLKEGLFSGALTLDQIKGTFNGKVMDLFPKDLTELGKKDISTLNDGLKSGQIDEAELKAKYDGQLNKIFKKDLSSLGKEDLATLKTAMDLGITDLDSLSEKYKKTLDGVFGKDISKLSADSMATLKVGIQLGLPGAQEEMDKISNAIKEGATVDLGEKGKFTMDSLLKAYTNSEIGIDTFMDGYRKLIKDKANINLKKEGTNTIETHASGMEIAKGKPKKASSNIRTVIQKNLTFDSWAYSKGQTGATKLGEGLLDRITGPLDASAEIGKGVVGNFNGIVDGANDLTSSLGGSGKISPLSFKGFPAHAKGTNGALKSAETAFVGDGGKQELIQYANGNMALSPDTPTLTHLPKGSQVFSGEQTEDIFKKFKNFGIAPMYAKGTGASVKDWFSSKIEDIMGFFDKPAELWKKLTSSAFSQTSFKGDSGENIGKGAEKHAESQNNWLKKLFDGMGGEEPSGAGVTRWAGTVKRALAMNHLPVTPAYVNAWLRQIQSESGGNPRAVQGNIGDINNKTGDLAKGLVQVIGTTFEAYKFPGHGNRLNGLDSLLAGINYAKSTYGRPGMLGVIGKGHGYANGGIVSQHQVAQIAEGNRAEAIIPLHPSKRNRAMQLLKQVKTVLGDDDGGTVVVNNQKNDNSELVALLTQQNALLMQLVNKDNNTYLDSKKLEPAITKQQQSKDTTRNFFKGVTY